ncbi:MAG: integrase [Frankiales bacterium]|nr:integrase [Frankiales bacterium]
MTTTTIESTDVVVAVEPLFSEAERIALAGFLAGYSGLTRDAYTLDLRMFTVWCQQHELHLFQARRADIECFGRDMESHGRARATIARRLCTIAGFFRYAVEEDLLEHSPAVHVRRPRLDYESHAIALDRNEVGSLLVAAGLGAPNEHALISLLAINGLRISEALGADIDKLGLERGHRTLSVLRKGGKIVTIPLAPPAPSIWRSANGLTDRSFCVRTGSGWIAIAPPGSCAASPAARASISQSAPTPCGTRSSPLRSMPACRCATFKRLPRTPIRVPPCGTTEPGSRSIGTPRT